MSSFGGNTDELFGLKSKSAGKDVPYSPENNIPTIQNRIMRKLNHLRRRFLKRQHIRLGEKGERLACNLLRNLGITILHRNYSGSHGEIDIVARDGAILCFVEVKTRRHRSISRPADAVTSEKKKKIIHTAHRYLRQIDRPSVVFRFDIIEVIYFARRLSEIRYWPSEFSSADIMSTD